MKLIEMYSKPGCHLCDIAREVILQLRSEVSFEFIETDITTDLNFFEKYNEDIPVIFVNNKFFSKYTINKELLQEELRK